MGFIMQNKIEDINSILVNRLRKAKNTKILAEPFMNQVLETVSFSPKPYYELRELKSVDRILAKIERYRKEDHKLTLRGAILKIHDLCGGRFLVHYLGDVEILFDQIKTIIETRKDTKLYGPADNCIEKPRESGFRALTQVIKFQIGSVLWFPFELQIMTTLAHDWDQKQHILYESPDRVPNNVYTTFAGLSDNLLQVDKCFDQLRSFVTDDKPAL
jgi:ppGpp synthetase/RelA/SpoT-type nucleotidyltranferase